MTTEMLFLSENQFSGPLPELSSKQLRGLYLSDNRLNGPIGSNLCNQTEMRALFLDTNKLNGTIPSCLGSLLNLEQLYLFNNALTGGIPSLLSKLTYLSKFRREKKKYPEIVFITRLNPNYLSLSCPILYCF
jgi:hypothetical protein